MNKCTLISVIILIVIGMFVPVAGEEYIETLNESEVQTRISVSCDFAIAKDLSLNLVEEIRLEVLPFASATMFNLSLTSVTLTYSPLKYLKTDAGYMLKLHGASSETAWSKHWSDANNYLRHRVFLGVTGSYSVGDWKFSLRERALCDMRFDDIDWQTDNQYLFTLRHYLSVSRSISPLNLSPYIWGELGNTLNANQRAITNRKQYLERWRICVGTRWKIPSEKQVAVTLNFFYRFEQTQKYSIQVTDTGTHTTRNINNIHAIGIGIEL